MQLNINHLYEIIIELHEIWSLASGPQSIIYISGVPDPTLTPKSHFYNDYDMQVFLYKLDFMHYS